jgi:hypothetical protein
MPFPFAPSQVGGGSEFAAEFDKTVISWDSGLFVPPPRPKRNGSVAPEAGTIALHMDSDQPAKDWEHRGESGILSG